jgi:hypothetical protein
MLDTLALFHVFVPIFPSPILNQAMSPNLFCTPQTNSATRLWNKTLWGFKSSTNSIFSDYQVSYDLDHPFTRYEHSDFWINVVWCQHKTLYISVNSPPFQLILVPSESSLQGECNAIKSGGFGSLVEACNIFLSLTTSINIVYIIQREIYMKTRGHGDHYSIKEPWN